MKLLSIDPGLKGGWACFDDHGFVSCGDLYKNEKIDWYAIANNGFDLYLVDYVVVEKQRGFFGFNRGAFQHGFTYGQLLKEIEFVVGLTWFRQNTIEIEPKKWQKILGKVGPKETKKASFELAKTITSEDQLKTPRGRLLDGRCDAICIGLWYMSQNVGNI